MTVELDGGTPIYTLMDMAGVQRLTTSDVLHIKALSIDGIIGISPIGQARQALGLAQHLASHADSFAKNAGRPGGVLRVSGWRTAQPGAAEDVRSDWETRFSGEQNAGKLLLLTGEGDIQYQQFALSMADAEFVAQRQLSTAEIARIFRIPPHLIGAPTGESLTYSNAVDQALQFVKFSLSPWLTVIEQALSADTDLSPSTTFVEFLLDGLLRADAATRATVYTAALNPSTGWMTRDEVRQLENLPAEDEPPAPPEPPPPPVVAVVAPPPPGEAPAAGSRHPHPAPREAPMPNHRPSPGRSRSALSISPPTAGVFAASSRSASKAGTWAAGVKSSNPRRCVVPGSTI